VSKRTLLFLTALASLVAIVLLLSSFTIRAAILLLAGTATGYLLCRSFIARRNESNSATLIGSVQPEDETFAQAKLFEATMSGMHEGLLVVDRDMRVVVSNEAARRLFNSSAAPLDSQRLTQLTRNPAIYSAFLDALQGNARSGVKVETFVTGRRIFDLQVVPLTPRSESPEGAIGIFFDVTRLEKLERVRQEFLSNVSHELRTPLTAILTFVETLESAPTDEENSKRFLSIIRKNAARMHNLIDDILELSAIESGTVKLDTREAELSAMVDDVLASLESQAASRRVTLTNNVELGTIVHVDPTRLEQMLTNLIENAIKFNREGGSVVVKFEEDEDQSRILVEDTGEGIPAQHLERLFERFYRVDRARSRDMGGTGLGLAIVKHLARAHGGEVGVESRVGEGTIFSIELPRNGKLIGE
jgi:two-component system phosphate regulon sensor histidine kinase PhoR